MSPILFQYFILFFEKINNVFSEKLIKKTLLIFFSENIRQKESLKHKDTEGDYKRKSPLRPFIKKYMQHKTIISYLEFQFRVTISH